jgi:uncharacterized protein (DUF362 family)
MKNILGVTPLRRYGTLVMRNKLHEAYANAGGIEQCFIDILKIRKPDLAILDASICVEGLMFTVDMKERLGDWLLLAGTDFAALDATAARIVKHDVDEVGQLGMAYTQGLGEIREDLIDVAGASVDELRIDWMHAPQVEEWGAGVPAQANVSGYDSSDYCKRSRMLNHFATLLLPMGTSFFLKKAIRQEQE